MKFIGVYISWSCEISNSSICRRHQDSCTNQQHPRCYRTTGRHQWHELWSDVGLLNFHPDKCHVLTDGKHQNIVHAHNCTLNGVELEHVSEKKDFEVIVDSNLKFEEHLTEKAIKQTSSAVSSREVSVVYTARFSKHCLLSLFVPTNVEYASAVWSPHLKKHINLI